MLIPKISCVAIWRMRDLTASGSTLTGFLKNPAPQNSVFISAQEREDENE
jgi:hypothetical protein